MRAVLQGRRTCAGPAEAGRSVARALRETVADVRALEVGRRLAGRGGFLEPFANLLAKPRDRLRLRGHERAPLRLRQRKAEDACGSIESYIAVHGGMLMRARGRVQ